MAVHIVNSSRDGIVNNFAQIVRTKACTQAHHHRVKPWQVVHFPQAMLTRRAMRARTLDTAGYTYDPFTPSDIFGAPNSAPLSALTRKDLPVGADDSALSQLTGPAFDFATAQGSGRASQFVPFAARQSKQTRDFQNLLNLGLFAAVVALALWF